MNNPMQTAVHVFVSQLRLTSHTMSEDPPPIHPGVALTNPHPLPDERKAEPSQPQDQCPLIANLPRDPEREEEGREESEEERKGDTTRFGEVWRLRREIADLKGRVEKQKADISKLREKEEKLKGRVKRREDRISILDHDLEKKCAEISKLREEGEEERERGITRFGEVWQLQKENGDLKGQVKKQLADISKLRDEEEMLKGEVKRREDRISVLDHDLEKMRNSWQESQNVRDSWQEAEIAKLRDEEEKLKGEVKRREDRILLLDQDLEKMRNSWQESQKAHDSWQETEMSKLRDVEEMLKGEVERREDQIAKLDHDLEKTRNGWQEANKVHTRQAQGMQERLKRTEELLATRSAELCEAQEFLPTVDRLSETEVLDIVHELNENIYQMAACLTEEWMKMESSRPPDKMKLDLTSQQRRPVLVQLTCNRDLAGLTFLIQLYLCYSATTITSSWVGDKDLVLIKDLYQRLSASGEYHRCQVVGGLHTYDRGASGLRQMEVIGPQLPLRPTSQCQIAGRKIGGSP